MKNQNNIPKVGCISVSSKFSLIDVLVEIIAITSSSDKEHIRTSFEQINYPVACREVIHLKYIGGVL